MNGTANKYNFVEKDRLENVTQKLKTLFIDEESKSPKRVVIIGAGISGLYAAYLLKQKGFNVTLLEGRNRIGGRVYTHVLDPQTGLNVELGGEWISKRHTKFINLVEELKLKLINHKFKKDYIFEDKYYKSGELITETSLHKTLSKILEEFKEMSGMDKINLDKVDFWHYLHFKNVPENEIKLLEINLEVDYGENIREISTYDILTYYSKYGFDKVKNADEDYKISGGNFKLIDALKDKIGSENIFLDKKVVEVNQKASTTQVLCDDKTSYSADFVICTMPATLINKVRWSPLLESEKINALENLNYSNIIKVPILFSDRFWEENDFAVITDRSPEYIYHATKGEKGDKGILMTYSSEKKAELLDHLDYKDKIKIICETLIPAFSNAESFVETSTSYSWMKDPFSKGAFAAYAPNQYSQVVDLLKSNHGRVVFAGEHLATNFENQGFMEGALESAERAVNEIELLVNN